MEQKSFSFDSIFTFDSMLTPKVISFVYLALLAIIVISAGAILINGSIFAAVGLLVLGSIAVRIWCELLIVLFKINENIQKIADR